MNTRKLTLIGLASALTLASLAGCAGSANEGTDVHGDVASDVPTASEAPTASDLPTASELLTAAGALDQTGDLGQGYDAQSGRIRAPYCLMKDRFSEVGYPEAGINMTLQSDQTQVARSLGVTTEFSYGVASAAAEFVRESTSDNRSVTYVFGSTMKLRDRQLAENPELTNVATSASDPMEFYDRCGDRYVQKTSRGASLYTMLKFQFSSESDKQSFEATMKAKGLVSASATLKAATEVASQGVQLKLSAVQVGGDVTQLPTAAKGNSALCAMGNVTECLGFLTGLEDYGRSTFPKQFAGKSGAALDAITATVDYTTAPWYGLGVKNAPAPSRMSPQAYEAFSRYGVESAKMIRMDLLNDLGVFANRSSAMVKLQNDAIATARGVVQGNEWGLRGAFDACNPSVTSGCARALQNAKAAHKAIDGDVLVPWFDAQYDLSKKIVDTRDLVDIRGDGHADFCRVYRTPTSDTLSCQLGVGKGFEQNVAGKTLGRISGLFVYKPTMWASVKDGARPAFCAPLNAGARQLNCALQDGTNVLGTVTIRREGESYTMTSDGVSTDGIDARKVYQSVGESMVARYGASVWPGR
jgi:hypothetical protein